MSYSFPFENLQLRGQNGSTGEAGGSALHFKHSLLPAEPGGTPGESLVIKTGANNVEWGYSLNAKRIPTYGGEVIQILSMKADNMTVSGIVRNYKEQQRIYWYFLNYLKLAGGMGAGGKGFERNQEPIKFSYPTRGWSFDIVVTDLIQMEMGLKVVTPGWGFTAEIVSENDRYEIGNALLTGMSSVLASNSPIIKNSNVKDGVIGFNADNPFSGALTANPNEFGSIVDERLQQQIASWATDNFSTYLFQNAVTSNSDTSFKSAADYYSGFFGSDVAFKVTGSGNNTNTTGDTTGTDTDTTTSDTSLSGTLSAVQVAALASIGLQRHGYDTYRNKKVLIEMVKQAAGESSWNTQAVHHNKPGEDPKASYDIYMNTKNPVESPSESWDLGLWQLNVYANGDTADKKGRKVSSDPTLLFNPLYNAEIIAQNKQGGRGYFNTVNGDPLGKPKGSSSGGYASSDAEAKKAVQQYLDDPAKYNAEVLNVVIAGANAKARDLADVAPISAPFQSTRSEFNDSDGPEGVPSGNGNHIHGGLDFFAPAGTKIRAPKNGKIVEVTHNDPKGNQVFGDAIKLELENGYVWVFRHTVALLKKGFKVEAGDYIATIAGWTGGSPHAHIEIWKKYTGSSRTKDNLIDPYPILKQIYEWADVKGPDQ